MKKSLALIPALALALTACGGTDNTQTLTPTTLDGATVQIGDFSEADKASFKEQLTQGLKREIAKINTPVQVSNIVSLDESTKTVQGKTKLVLTFKTADGKTYITHQDPTALTDVQRERLRKLKGATLRGVIAIQDRPNEFFFGGLENPIY